MAEKCLVYGKGLARRGRHADATFFSETAQTALERWFGAPDAALEAACARMRAMLKRGETSAAPIAPGKKTAADPQALYLI